MLEINSATLPMWGRSYFLPIDVNCWCWEASMRIQVLLLAPDNGCQIAIYPYSGKFKPAIQDDSIATVATMWIHPENGQAYILISNKALYDGDWVKVTLLNPDQFCAIGVKVEDVPRQFDLWSLHLIYHPTAKLRIPLSLHGCES